MTRKAEELVSASPICINKWENIATAQKLMRESGNRHLIVVDEGYHMVGLLSDTDCLKAGDSPVLIENLPIEKLMKTPVSCVPYDTPIHKIANLMSEKNISAVVVQSPSQVIGIVTHEDIAKDKAESQ